LENKQFLDQDFLTQPGTVKSLHAYTTSFYKVCTNWKYSPTAFDIQRTMHCDIFL